MRRLALACVAFTLLVSGCANAPLASQGVQRNFPPTAMRGALVVGEAPEVLVNGKPARLSPGVRIHDGNNMGVMASSLAGGRYLVHYTVDTLGLVKEVWILRADEAAVRPWPSTPQEAQAWSFDPAAQVWVKP